MAGEHVHIDLELERDSDPIRGTVHAQSGAVEFSGWLALIAELDGLRRTGDPDQEDDQQ